MSDGYLYISKEECGELCVILAEASRTLDDPTATRSGEWIDKLAWGRDAVAFDKVEAVELIDHLYTISSEADSQLHIDTRTILYRLQDTLKDAQVPPQKRRISLDGPGR